MIPLKRHHRSHISLTTLNCSLNDIFWRYAPEEHIRQENSVFDIVWRNMNLLCKSIFDILMNIPIFGYFSIKFQPRIPPRLSEIKADFKCSVDIIDIKIMNVYTQSCLRLVDLTLAGPLCCKSRGLTDNQRVDVSHSSLRRHCLFYYSKSKGKTSKIK